MKPSEIQARLQAAGFRHTRKLGQHFLLDPNLLRAIARAGDVGPGDCVLEVGTGAGTLTRVLAAQAGRVVTCEVDDRLDEVSRWVLGGVSNLVHVRGDALKGEAPGRLHPEIEAALQEAAAQNLQIKCVSNFPYQVATVFLLRLLERSLIDGAFPLAVVAGTVQREVAERLAAKGLGRKVGAPTAEVQALCRVELDRRVRAACFWPPPKVESAVIRVTPLPDKERISAARWPAYRDLVRALFGMRRKAVQTTLRRGVGLDAEQAAAALQQAGIDPGARVESLTVEDLRRLAEALEAGAR